MMKCNEVITNDSVHNNHKIERIIAQADVATRVAEPEKTAEMMKEIFQVNGK